MRLMYSGRDFAWIYERQDQISFLDGHVRAFAHFDGVPARVAYDNLRAAVVRILVGGTRTLTPRFAALASHYLLEACFCRPGEGHDKGGVEARGKAVREQALVPIPSGPTLTEINAALLARMDARLDTRRDAAGHTIGARFTEEQRLFRLAPLPFAPEATTFATVTPRALVRLEGAVYSVWTRWAGLDLVVRIGASTVTIVGRDGTHVQHPRKRFGERSIDYRHYLAELARKPSGASGAARSPAGSGRAVSRDLGSASRGEEPRDAARLFAKVLGQLDLQGAAVVVPALTAALATGTASAVSPVRRFAVLIPADSAGCPESRAPIAARCTGSVQGSSPIDGRSRLSPGSRKMIG